MGAVAGAHLRSHTPSSLAVLWPDLPLDDTVARRIVSRVVGEDRDDLEGVRGLSHRLAREIAARSRTSAWR